MGRRDGRRRRARVPVHVRGLIVIALVLMAALACSGDTGMVQGRVLEVVDRSPTEIELLRVRDDAGKVWTFTTERALFKDGSHLRLHQAMGESVVVLYESKNGRLVATGIND